MPGNAQLDRISYMEVRVKLLCVFRKCRTNPYYKYSLLHARYVPVSTTDESARHHTHVLARTNLSYCTLYGRTSVPSYDFFGTGVNDCECILLHMVAI
jgi:hypothetical protein